MSLRHVRHIAIATKQRGAALAVALILLVVMTLLGLSSVRGIAQQGKMASHAVDRSLYYQFAEAALREGEAQAQNQALVANNGFPNNQYLSDGQCNRRDSLGQLINDPSVNDLNRCNNGLCATPDPDCPPRWEDPAFQGWFPYNGLAAVQSQAGNALVGTATSGVGEYFVEILRPVTIDYTPPLPPHPALCSPPGGSSFDEACNLRYRSPEPPQPVPQPLPPPPLEPQESCTPPPGSTPPPGTGTIIRCNSYRYRVTARVQAPGRAAVIVQSIISVEP